MIKFFKNLYLNTRLYVALGVLAAIFAFGYSFPFLFEVGIGGSFLLGLIFLLDVIWIHLPSVKIQARRIMPIQFSLGDQNPIRIEVQSESPYPLQVDFIDELPTAFQKRDFIFSFSIAKKSTQDFNYTLFPAERGLYEFGDMNFFLTSPIGLVQRRYVEKAATSLPAVPSVIQMKKYELLAFSNTAQLSGLRKIRRLGHSYEFEQIKNYVIGDDYRSINWKATSRRGHLMVNQYEDEKSQAIYTILDKSRVMRMPFEGLSLLDYAINTILTLSNIALKKSDRAGLITFSEQIDTVLPAEQKAGQLGKISNALYAQQTNFMESDYEKLYHTLQYTTKGRALMLLFTNFESLSALERVLPILRKISRKHLLVVVFFENTELLDYAQEESKHLLGVYQQTIAHKFVLDKRIIAEELRRHGIQCILTKPQDLSVNTINKYLELKARGMI
ncbi:DUF58 domain-containing protein [Hugenholtzia roseola]|uniref:DUF58 domain-containing protein n=1 Tax=Hugenholtzia roseola TaxID=1002 RepID=UPI0003FA2A08|nr:DUF58 domain-containing protein [Hugenholtzia roseola]